MNDDSKERITAQEIISNPELLNSLVDDGAIILKCSKKGVLTYTSQRKLKKFLKKYGKGVVFT